MHHPGAPPAMWQCIGLSRSPSPAQALEIIYYPIYMIYTPSYSPSCLQQKHVLTKTRVFVVTERERERERGGTGSSIGQDNFVN